MTTFTQSLIANQNVKGNLSTFRWYFGTFKQTSAAALRAVSRAIQNFITQDY